MFKILLLQRWYNLSDEALESALYDRISFARFAGLSLEDDVPDATTICRFRSSLAERDKRPPPVYPGRTFAAPCPSFRRVAGSVRPGSVSYPPARPCR